jgi:protoheme IX farnesyltransferase
MESATLAVDMDEAVALPRAGTSPAARVADFVALTKPRMNFLVVVTTGVGYFMAAHGWNDWSRLLNTLAGTALTAAGASVLNQLAERELDARMVRTQDRPLPAGRVMPIEALIWGSLLAIVGIAELLVFVNALTAALAAFTLASYVFLYTPLKRYSTLCTIVGAVPGAVPIVMGWSAVRGSLSPETIALFGIMFLWQMPHFLAIAILYRDDYAAGGFKMLPVVDTTLRTTAGQIVLYAAALIPVSLLPTLLHTTGVIYLTAAMALGAIFAGFGVLCALSRARAEARQLFLVSIIYLPLLLCVMMVDKM